MANHSGIYKIAFNDNFYIGSSNNLVARKTKHFNLLKHGKHHNKRLQNIYNKYGVSALVFSIIEHCAESDLISREQYYIDSLKPSFNHAIIAGGRFKAGTHLTDEQKQHLSKVHIGKKLSDSTKNKLSAINTGKKHSNKTKAKVGEASRKAWSDDKYRAHLSNKRKEMWSDAEYKKTVREKINARLRSEEISKKISAGNKRAHAADPQRRIKAKDLLSKHRKEHMEEIRVLLSKPRKKYLVTDIISNQSYVINGATEVMNFLSIASCTISRTVKGGLIIRHQYTIQHYG